MAPVGPGDDEEKEEEEATLVRANRAIESAERRCHFWCDAKTLQWQLKVITRAINAATAAATATAKKHTQTAEPASSGSNQKWPKGKTAEMQEKQRQ